MTHHFSPGAMRPQKRVIGSALGRARSALQCSTGLTPASTGIPRARRLAFDPLEKRFLLSADISPYLDNLDDGLDRLEALADDLEQFGEMAANIPVLGESLGEAAQFGETLRSELIDPIQAFLNDGITDTFAELEAAMEGIARNARFKSSPRGAFDAVITDLRMPGLDGEPAEDGGMQLLRALLDEDPSLPVIVLTAHGTVDTAVEAVKSGALDFLEKPFDKEQIATIVGKAVATRQRSGPRTVRSSSSNRSRDLRARSWVMPAIGKV